MTGSAIHKRTQKIKVFGSDSTKSEREQLIEILRNRVEYHKDKIISPTIYEELCGLEVKKNGRVEHSTNTHDDQVFSWLWALYVYYCGGDLMNNWGITRRELKTDADLEEAVLDIQEEQSGLVEELDLVENEEVNNQLDMMNQAPGKQSYEEWMQSELRKDEECLNRLMSNKAVKKTLAERYHSITPQANQTVQTIPTEVFLNFNNYDDPVQETNKVYAGNLSKYWEGL